MPRRSGANWKLVTISTLHDRASQRNTDFPSHEQALRAALQWVRARHDSGAVSPAVFSVMRMIETELSWLEHRGEAAP
jgi:hypothetical protein